MEFLALDNTEEQYTRPDVFAKSSKELAEELATARTANIISQYNAIKEYNGYTDDEAQAEYERIQSETPTKSLSINDDTNVQ